jgi:Holliday junction resolvase RusA-like endonuclease
VSARSICFAIDVLPISQNKLTRAHFTVRTKERDMLTMLIREVMQREGIAPIVGPFRYHVTFYVNSRRRFDAHNHVKNLMDACVLAGLIPDDGAPLVVHESFSVRLDRSSPGTEIEITEADAPAWQAAPRRARKKKQAA